MSPLARWLDRAIARYQARGGGEALFNVACNFTPSCSEYTRQAIRAHGALCGARLGFRRICRCDARDATETRADPVPDRC